MTFVFINLLFELELMNQDLSGGMTSKLGLVAVFNLWSSMLDCRHNNIAVHLHLPVKVVFTVCRQCYFFQCKYLSGAIEVCL